MNIFETKPRTVEGCKFEGFGDTVHDTGERRKERLFFEHFGNRVSYANGQGTVVHCRDNEGRTTIARIGDFIVGDSESAVAFTPQAFEEQFEDVTPVVEDDEPTAVESEALDIEVADRASDLDITPSPEKTDEVEEGA